MRLSPWCGAQSEGDHATSALDLREERPARRPSLPTFS
jgi:hypothetical protein